MPDLADVVALETRVWQALVDGDAETDREMLTPGFLGVYASGFANQADHTGQLAGGPVMQSFDLDDARLMVIGSDHVLLSYRARYVRAGSGKPEVMFISSMWERDGKGWLNNFSQDTPAEPSAT